MSNVTFNNVSERGPFSLRKLETPSSSNTNGVDDSSESNNEELVDDPFEIPIVQSDKSLAQEEGPITHRRSSYFLTLRESSPPDERRRVKRNKTLRKIRSSIVQSGQKLRQDVYSMLFLSEPFSRSYFFSLFSIFFQYCILSFLMMDLIDLESSNNALGIPAGVTDSVAVAQAFGVILAVLSSEDLIDALAFFDIIFHKNVFDVVPNATPCSWFLTWFLKFAEGSTSLVVIFVLLLKSETVLALFLNFAALSFVWAIDDVFFYLAKSGYFGIRITESAFSTSIITIPKNASRRYILIRNLAFYIILIAMFGSWGFIFSQQRRGHFLCNQILAQFGDSYEPATSRLSGHFELEKARLFSRVVYANKHNADTEYPFIAYCDSKKAWTLSQHNSTNQNYDSCTNAMAWSPTTLTFDVTTEGNSWVSIRRNDTKKKFIPYSSIRIECIDCSKQINPLRDTCSYSGQCVGRLCKCDEGNYGKSCEYENPCPFLQSPQGPAGKPFESSFKNGFQPFRNGKDELVLVQEKPVYIEVFNDTLPPGNKGQGAPSPGNNGQGAPSPGNNGQGAPSPGKNNNGGELKKQYLIFFNGYRWVFISLLNFEQYNYTKNENINIEFADFLSNKFHPYYSNYEAKLMSEPMPQSLPGDGFDPRNLEWYHVIKDKNLKYEEQGSFSVESTIRPLRCEENLPK